MTHGQGLWGIDNYFVKLSTEPASNYKYDADTAAKQTAHMCEHVLIS